MTVPFASTRPIHPDWARHHAPASRGTMNAECTITLGGTAGGWSPETGPTAGDPTTTYTGQCRVTYRDAQSTEADAADQQTSTAPVTIALPLDSPAQARGARVTITEVDANGPASLIGRVFTVETVAHSSITLEQLLTCTDDQTNQPGA